MPIGVHDLLVSHSIWGLGITPVSINIWAMPSHEGENLMAGGTERNLSFHRYLSRRFAIDAILHGKLPRKRHAEGRSRT